MNDDPFAEGPCGSSAAASAGPDGPAGNVGRRVRASLPQPFFAGRKAHGKYENFWGYDFDQGSAGKRWRFFDVGYWSVCVVARTRVVPGWAVGICQYGDQVER